MTGEQLGQLEARLAGQDRTIFRLLSRTGLRAGELFGLQWQDLNPNQLGVPVVQETREGRDADRVGELAEALS